MVAFVGQAPTGAPPGVPKYLNSPATDLYTKADVLFGLSQGSSALAVGALPVLVEGPLDALAVTTATGGACVGLAPCGTALTGAQVRALAAVVDLRARGVVVATDADGPGRSAAVRAYDLLAPVTVRLTAADLPAGSDPAEHLARRGPVALTGALTTLARPLLDAVVEARVAAWGDRLRWVEGRVGAARDLAPLLTTLDQPRQASWVQRVAARLDLDPATVRDLLPAPSPAPSPVTPAGVRPVTAAVPRPGASGAGPPPPSTPVHRPRTR